MEIDKKNFEKKYPKITKELEQGSNKIKIGFEETEEELSKINQNIEFSGYDPSIIDFIRRCNTIEKTESIINYLEKRGEITEKCGRSIRNQIKKKGIRSFCSKKSENYYFKNSKGT